MVFRALFGNFRSAFQGGSFTLSYRPSSNNTNEVTMQGIRVLIADDHQEFRRIVHRFLESFPNISVVGEAIDGIDVVSKTEELNPDVVLMDIAMPHRNGLDATRIIKQRWPSKVVVIVTMHDDEAYRLRAQEAHADGFILKSTLKPSLEATFGEGSRLLATVSALNGARSRNC